MSVRYKFKNDLAFTTLHIDGFDISVIDLKKAIHQAEKIGRITDFDLIITNSETEEAYAKDEDLVPKNTSLIVIDTTQNWTLIMEQRRMIRFLTITYVE